TRVSTDVHRVVKGNAAHAEPEGVLARRHAARRPCSLPMRRLVMRMRLGAPLVVALVALFGAVQSAHANNCGAATYSCCPQPSCDAQCCFSSAQNQCRTAYKLVYDTVLEKRWQTCYKQVNETVMQQVQKTCYRNECRTCYRTQQCTVMKTV